MEHRKSRAATRRPVRAWLMTVICVGISLWLALHMPARAEEPACRLELRVLGVAQDAGMPQIGHPEDPAWADPTLARLATSLAVIDHRSGARWLFDATPDIKLQMQRLDAWTGVQTPGLRLDGVFLTHAHIGHYAGLMMLGREAAGARGVPVFAMPRMGRFLRDNGPWSQLVELNNIDIRDLADARQVTLDGGLTVTPFLVPHRDEYSETVGFVIRGPDAAAVFLPDIDDWDRWQAGGGAGIEAMIRQVDAAYLDATFFADGELRGVNMATIPHPRIRDSMDRFEARLTPDERARVRFIHLNHSNPARYPDSPETAEVERRGFALAQEGEGMCLSRGGWG
jgi:pyrroloquinoline quinone biosynthesis protein B